MLVHVCPILIQGGGVAAAVSLETRCEILLVTCVISQVTVRQTGPQ